MQRANIEYYMYDIKEIHQKLKIKIEIHENHENQKISNKKTKNK